MQRNFRNFIKNFAPNSALNLLRIFNEFSCFVSWERRPLKLHQKLPTFQCQIPRQICRKNSQKVFWRAGRFLCHPVFPQSSFPCTNWKKATKLRKNQGEEYWGCSVPELNAPKSCDGLRLRLRFQRRHRPDKRAIVQADLTEIGCECVLQLANCGDSG